MKIIGSKGSVEMSLEMMQRSFEGYADSFPRPDWVKFSLVWPKPNCDKAWWEIICFMTRELEMETRDFAFSDFIFSIAYNVRNDRFSFCEIMLYSDTVEYLNTVFHFKIELMKEELEEFMIWIQRILVEADLDHDQQIHEHYMRHDHTSRFGRYFAPGDWRYGGFVQRGSEAEFVNYYLVSLPEEQREAIRQAISEKNAIIEQELIDLDYVDEEIPC